MLGLVFPLVAFLLVEGGRRYALSRSLYSLNLRSAPVGTVLSLPQAGQRILLFAPHEDDETLGCGGYIQQAVAAGASVHVVFLTSGEAEPLAAMVFEETLRPRPTHYVRLGYARQREAEAALKLLGLSEADITFLNYPNLCLHRLWLPEHWSPESPLKSRWTGEDRSPFSNSLTPRAPHCGEALVEDIRRVLQAYEPDMVLTCHPHDVHVDHWPAFAAVMFALEELAAEGHGFARRCGVLTYLIHRSCWPAPKRYRPWMSLEPPASLAELGETQWSVLPLSVSETLTKRRATTIYRTQAGAFAPLLASFSRANELFGVVSTRMWPERREVPLTTILREPTNDSLGVVRNGAADVVSLALGRSGDQLKARILLRGKASPKVGYHLSLHAGGKTRGARYVAAYHWKGSRAEGRVYSHKKTRTLPPATVRSFLDGSTSTVLAPWPFEHEPLRFILVRAWTTYGSRAVDQTSVAVLRVSASRGGASEGHASVSAVPTFAAR